MKTGDILGVLYVAAYLAIVFFFPFKIVEGSIAWSGLDINGSIQNFTGLKNFGAVVAVYPYISGFLKVGLLATYGEMLKMRGRTGSWKTPDLLPKFIVWGLFGVLFTYVFALFAKGAGAMMGTVLWPIGVSAPYSEMTFIQSLTFAFTTSFWMNMIFCYPMMLGHEWFNEVIKAKRFVGGTEFLEHIDKKVWGSFMLKVTVLFWIPAHTVTFTLPPDYRILMSALLSLALGFILTVKPKKKPAAA